jgi:hypothetical protein
MDNKYFINLLQKNGVYDYLEINSQEEVIMRNNIINMQNTPINKLFTQRRLTKFERAYLVYSIISGLELIVNTNDCDWCDYYSKINKQFYSSNIALTSGQNKLLILSLLDDNANTISHILNTYQLIYLNDVFQREKWELNNHQIYFNESWRPTYAGVRTQDISEIMNDFFHNPETKYTNKNIRDYIVLAFRKLYSFNRFLESNKSFSLHQLIQFLNILVCNMNIDNKFREFLHTLDEEQIFMIGM